MSDAQRGGHHAARDDGWPRGTAIAAGALLILLGVSLLAVNTFGMELPFDLGQVGWPVFVIAPGVALLIVGLVSPGDGGQGLAVAGGIVSTVGLLLAYQTMTGHWASWAYAWALVAPGAVGAALLLWGLLHGRGDTVRQGVSALGIGLVLFIVGFAFFEGLLHIGRGQGFAPIGLQLLPVALVVAGALVIIGGLLPRRTRPQPVYGGWVPPSYPPAGPPPGPPPAGPPPAGPPPAFVAPDSDDETTTHQVVS